MSTINNRFENLTLERLQEIYDLIASAPASPSSVHRHDFNVYDYLGVAPSGSSDASNVWTITRLTIASNGSVTTGIATGVNWTGRYTHTYL
jgi:hypothetical protein